MKFFAFAALLGSTQAWWGPGHLLVARIAQDIMEKEDPAAFEKVLTILHALKINDPGYTEGEDKHPFVECATMADDIKYKGGGYQSGWHYVDTPYVDTPGKTIKDYPTFVPDTHDNTQAINGILAWMRKDAGYQDNYFYKTIMSHVWHDGTEADALSSAMRFLIHYTGDVHQPLHATARVDDEFPAGDRGGNSFHLTSHDGAKNLHAVWDSVIYSETGHPTLPIPASDWNTLGINAAKLVEEHPLADVTDLKSLDPAVWAKDSFEKSEFFVYDHIAENASLPADYIKQGQSIAEKQIVIGGFRLAHVLMSIYGDSGDKFLY